MVGIVCGTYSSVCITGSLWYVMTVYKNKRMEEKKAAEKASRAAAKSSKK